MKNLSNHWYKFIALICAFLLLLMVYRREARMRTHMRNLEARIEALELYTHGKGQVDSIRLSKAAENKPIEQKRQSNHVEKRVRMVEDKKGNIPTTSPTEPSQDKDDNEYIGKFQEVIRLELNTIDSATLIRVPGIGEGTARAILTYREKLGGYYSAEQLREKLTWESAQTNLETWCKDWFWADESLVQKLQINTLSFKQLVHHPYLEFEDVKAIVKWRDRHKRVANAADLEQMGIADSTKLEKLLHYVEF